jgi:serine/threonine protein kinase
MCWRWWIFLDLILKTNGNCEKHILHGHIPTKNIFLTKNKTIRIGDLGIAKSLKLGYTNTIARTSFYISPKTPIEVFDDGASSLVLL